MTIKKSQIGFAFLSTAVLSISGYLVASPLPAIAPATAPLCSTLLLGLYPDCLVQAVALISKVAPPPPQGCIKTGGFEAKLEVAVEWSDQATGVPEEPCKID